MLLKSVLMLTYMEQNYVCAGTYIFYHFLFSKCTAFQHEQLFNVALFSIDLNNDILYFKSPKHVTSTILQLQNTMGGKKRKLHLNVDEEQNLGKENKGKLYPGISTDTSKLGTFLKTITCMFEGH